MKTWSTVWLDMLSKETNGPTRLRVQGRSMWPTLQPGDSILVMPVAVGELVSGDWIVVRNAHSGVVHRYLGPRGGDIVTKGDAHLGCDPLWSPDAVWGRVVEVVRQGRVIYQRSAAQVRRERWRTVPHRMTGQVWAMLRRAKALILGLLGVLAMVTGVWAAVTVAEFTAEGQTDSTILSWETASETGNLGFYIWRSTTGNVDDYAKLSEFIQSEDEGLGAFYEYVDYEVQADILYYYQVQDVPDNGANGEFFGPVTATLTAIVTGTATPVAPSATPTPTSTPTSAPTATPHPYVRFWTEDEAITAGECTVVQWIATHVKAVYLDGRGVVGEGAQTFCPCVSQTHVLDVAYSDGGGEQFSITLEVSGECDAQDAATATPTLTATPLPSAPTDGEAAEEKTATPTPRPTVSFPETHTPAAEEDEGKPASAAPTMTATTPDDGASPTSTLASENDDPPAAARATVFASPTRLAVEGEDTTPRVTSQMIYLVILFVGSVLGLGFIGSGIWLWKRQQ